MSTYFGFDETRGEIIGAFTVRYEFWQECETFHKHGIKGGDGKPILDLIDRQYFENDDEALEWLQEHYPAEWEARHSRPIEMRVFDQPGKRERAMIDARNGGRG